MRAPARARKPKTVIPATQAGYYYVLISGRSEPGANTAVQLTVSTLPFEVTAVTPDQGGDAKYVTVDIYGAQFMPNALVKLVRPVSRPKADSDLAELKGSSF